MRIKLLGKVYQQIISREDVRQQAAAYDRAIKSKEWQFLRDVMITMKAEMVEEMFGAGYTKLSPEEKDVIQKVYYHLNEILDFLISPVSWVKHKGRFPSVSGGAADPTRKGEGNARRQQ